MGQASLILLLLVASRFHLRTGCFLSDRELIVLQKLLGWSITADWVLVGLLTVLVLTCHHRAQVGRCSGAAAAPMVLAAPALHILQLVDLCEEA